MNTTHRLIWDADDAGQPGKLTVFAEDLARKLAASFRAKGYRGLRLFRVHTTFTTFADESGVKVAEKGPRLRTLAQESAEPLAM